MKPATPCRSPASVSARPNVRTTPGRPFTSVASVSPLSILSCRKKSRAALRHEVSPERVITTTASCCGATASTDDRPLAVFQPSGKRISAASAGWTKVLPRKYPSRGFWPEATWSRLRRYSSRLTTRRGRGIGAWKGHQPTGDVDVPSRQREGVHHRIGHHPEGPGESGALRPRGQLLPNPVDVLLEPRVRIDAEQALDLLVVVAPQLDLLLLGDQGELRLAGRGVGRAPPDGEQSHHQSCRHPTHSYRIQPVHPPTSLASMGCNMSALRHNPCFTGRVQ